MILEELRTTRETYGVNKGQHNGKIKYESERGEVSVLLTPEISKQLLGFIGPVITKCMSECAAKLESDLRQSVEEAKTPITIEQISESKTI